MDIALALWTLLYNPPKQEFNFKGYIPPIEAAEPVQATKAVHIEAKKTPPVKPQQVVSQPIEQEVLTQEQYTQVRPEPTGCHLGDSIPMEACIEK